MLRRTGSALGAAVLMVAVACSSGTTKKSSPSPSTSAAIALPTFGPGASYHPAIDPADFSPNVDNPWFPLKPGVTLIYKGTKDEKQARDLLMATTQTKVVGGVTCRVVSDLLYLNGKLAERTSDYYAQDTAGNVWYFGEDTAELDASGKVKTTEGTWHYGVGGAQPGVFTEANPEMGRLFRQEYSKGQAEDQYKVISLNADVKVPYGSYSGTLRTEETTTLEPDIVDNKVYVRGIGEVLEIQVKGPPPIEKLELVEVKTS